MKEKLSEWLKENISKKWMLFSDQMLFRFKDDNVSAIGSQLAYYLILSIFPFLIFLLNMVQFTPLASGEILDSIVRVLPLDTQDMIKEIVNSVINASSGALISVSAITGIWTASSGINQLLKAINKAYDYEEGRGFLKLRLLSMLFTIILAIMIILVFGSLIFGEVIGRKIFSVVNISEMFSAVWSVLRIVIAILFMTITFTLLFRFGPSKPKGDKMTFKAALPGALFTTIGWMLSSTLFSFYVNNFGKYSVTYGSLGGIIVFLIWLYISSIIIVLGGEVNATMDYLNTNNWTYDKKKSMVKKIIIDEKKTS